MRQAEDFLFTDAAPEPDMVAGRYPSVQEYHEDKPPEERTWEEMMAKAKRDSENTGFVDPGEEERKRQEEYRKWLLDQDDTDDDTEKMKKK